MKFQRINNSSEEEWLKLRQEVLTASDIGVILGLNRWKSVKEMTENKINPNFIENSYVWLGQQLEPVVVSAVNKVLDTDFELFEDKGFFVDFDIGLGATPDAGDGAILLECKSTKPRNSLRWAWNPPLYYITQLYTQMMCCDRQVGYLAVLGTNLTQHSPELKLPLAIHRIQRRDWIDNRILQEVKRYWDCRAKNKMYRVDRKGQKVLELKLRFEIRRIY